MIDDAINQFRTSIGLVLNLDALYSSITPVGASVDSSDLLRFEIVMAVSALDSYVHRVIEEGMCEILSGTRTETDGYLKFRISLQGVKNSVTASGKSTTTVSPPDQWLRDEIHSIHSFQAFQKSENVADALRLITPKPIWVEVARRLHEDPRDIKTQLDLIANRRNQIVHESDIIYDPISPGNRWPVNQAMTFGVLIFITSIIEAIHTILS